jgi:hypothetical protein
VIDKMKETKKQTTTNWKTNQLQKSIKDLCDEVMKKSKEKAQKEWEKRND